mgnify:FL=1|jgi:hypothetical protein
MNEFETRKLAIERYLAGEKPINIYESLNRSSSWFFKWLKMYNEQGLCGLKDKSKKPHHVANKTDPNIEKLVINTRKRLMDRNTPSTKYASAGADTILFELQKLDIGTKLPSITTINRIIKHNGLAVSKGKKKFKSKSLPYPEPIADGPNCVHQFDTIGPRYISGNNGTEKLYMPTLGDVYSKVVKASISTNIQSQTLLNFLVTNVWSQIGIPKILQTDNTLAIKGSNRHPRTLSHFLRICLLLQIEVLFIPIKEPWRNGFIESFNDYYQELLFGDSLDDGDHASTESDRLLSYYNTEKPHSGLSVKKHGFRIPQQVHFSHNVNLLPSNSRIFKYIDKDTRVPLEEGKISFIRFIRSDCKLYIFSEAFDLPERLKYQYVKATIMVTENVMNIYCQDKLEEQIPYILNK